MNKKEFYEMLYLVTEYEGELNDQLLLEEDLGMESLMFIDLVSFLESKTGKKIVMHLLATAATVGELFEIIK